MTLFDFFGSPPVDPGDHPVQAPLLVSGCEAPTFVTSIAAAVSVEDTKAQQRKRVLACIREAGDHGRTDDELQVLLGLDGSSERPRRWELWKADRIVAQTVTRKTRTGRQAVVWMSK